MKPETRKAKLGILLSGRGSNFLAIADSITAGRIPNAEIAVVVSNKPYAPGIIAAEERRLNAHVIQSKGLSRADHDKQMIACLREHDVELVCLAGYMRLLSSEFIAAYPQRIVNIHPSLLPAFPGLDAQRQALEYGAKVTGCTVHFVDEELDHGAIIAQKTVSVLPDDTEEALSARVLEQEHICYTEAINLVLSGNYEINGRRFLPKSR